MIKAMKTMAFRGAAGRRRAVAWQAAPVALVRPVCIGLIAVVLSGARLMLDLSPFGAAFFAAGVFTGENPVALLLGCVLGAVLGGFEWMSLMLPVGCALILGGSLLVDKQVQNGKLSADVVVASLAGLGILVPGIVRGAMSSQVLDIALALGASLIAAIATPAFSAALRIRGGRLRLMVDEQAGIAGIVCTFILGLMSFHSPITMYMAAGLAALAVLFMAGLGSGLGAMAGVLAGFAMVLGGAGPEAIAYWSACGMCAGVLCGYGRYAATGGMLGAAGLLALYMPDLTYLVPTIAACAVYCILPKALLERVQGFMDVRRRGSFDPDLLADKLRSETEQKLRALSAAFGELADGYKVPIDMPDEQELITDMRGALCENCARYAACWTGDDNRAVRLLCQLISESIERGGTPFADGEIPPDVMRICARGHTLTDRLGAILTDFSDKRKTELKRSVTNQLISAQFLQAQMLLRGMADKQAQPLRVRDRQAQRAQAALDREGISTSDVLAFRGDRMEIVAMLTEGQWTPELAESAAACISVELGKRFAPDMRFAMNEKELKLVQLPILCARAGVSCLSSEAGVPSGDSHMVRMLSGDRLMLALSDGMGSGESAARESAQTIKLLWRFLSADVGRALALETVNELMLVKSGEDMFATVDLCLVDLSTGMAEFSKLAACRSLIVRGCEILPVEGGRLPLGILEKVRPSVTSVQLKPGDVLLLGSDGIMDAIADEHFIESVMLENATMNPSELAEAVLRAVQMAGDAKYRDDMTAICARIAKRKSENMASSA